MAAGTRQGLALAFAAASRAQARNHLLAQMAQDRGDEQRARLLRALAQSQQVQARRLLMILRGKLPGAGLEAELEELAAAFAHGVELARAEEDQPGARALEQCRQVSQHSRDLAEQAGAELHLCQVCGYLAAGPVPERCPVCGAVPERFRRLE